VPKRTPRKTITAGEREQKMGGCGLNEETLEIPGDRSYGGDRGLLGGKIDPYTYYRA